MRLSHSSKNTFLECPRKYFNHYFRKLRTVNEGSALVFGDAIDQGLNHLLEHKNLEEAIKVFEAAWNVRRDEQNIKYSKADLQEELIVDLTPRNEKDKSWLSLNEKGKILLKEYNEQVIPLFSEVIKIQIEDVLPNEQGDELVIKTDFVAKMKEDGRTILFDNKTSSVKYEKDSVQKSDQLGTYYEALKDQYKLDACGYIVIPKKINKKKKPAVKIEIIIDQVLEETIEKTFKDYEYVLSEVKNANFPKNEESCIGIFGKCVFYDYCRNGSLTGLVEKKEHKK